MVVHVTGSIAESVDSGVNATRLDYFSFAWDSDFVLTFLTWQ